MGKGRWAGKGLLPPNPVQWQYERYGLDLRAELHLSLDEPLDPFSAFALLDGSAEVVAASDLELPTEVVQHLRGPGSRAWSGLAIPFPDGSVVIVYNDCHAGTRIRATLMEEFFHVRLGHRPTSIQVRQEGGRTYDQEIESEAFGSGAAALVPYKALRTLIDGGGSARTIAEHFRVSEPLVVFRAKVTRQYRRLARKHPRWRTRKQSG